MKKHETVQPAPMTAEQFKELTAAVVKSIPTNLGNIRAQYWIGKKGKLAEEMQKLLAGEDGISPELQSWVELYREEFGIELDLGALALPAEAPNTWLVIADERVTNNQVYEACAKRFPCSRYTEDLNTIRDLHAKGTTTRRFHATVEADPERKNQSADDIERAGLTPKAITPKERMFLELWYSRVTGKHLDINNWTICAGSRHPDGRVPVVGWSDDRMYVGWVSRGFRRGRRYVDGRARVAVS